MTGLIFGLNLERIVEAVKEATQGDPQRQFHDLVFSEMLHKRLKYFIWFPPGNFRNLNGLISDELIYFIQSGTIGQ